MKLNVSLQGRVALVCGASSGIGAASAQMLAEQGARVIGLARRKAELEKIVAGLPGQGHVAVECDLSNHALLREKVSSVLASTGGVHILICNSSGPKPGALMQADPEAFVQAFGQHLVTNQILAQLLTPGMKKARYGRIINIISTSVKVPIPNLGVSNTIRAAVASWAKTLAFELAADGITVNSVLPGYTTTDRLSSLLAGAAKSTGVSEETVAAEWKKSIPAQRFAEPGEIAAAVTFLASPAAAYINGVALAVDGGRTGCL